MSVTYFVFNVISTLKIQRFSKKMISALILYLEHRTTVKLFLQYFSIFDILRLWILLERVYSFISMCFLTIAEYNKYRTHSILKVISMYIYITIFFISTLFYLLRTKENEHIPESYYSTHSLNFKRVFNFERTVIRYLGVILPVGISYIYSLSQIASHANKVIPVLVDEKSSINGILNNIDIAWMSILVLSNTECYQLIYPFLAYFSVYLKNNQNASYTLLDFSYNLSFAINISFYVLPKFIYPYIFKPKYYYFSIEPYRISILRLRYNFKSFYHIVFTKYFHLRNTVVIWASYKIVLNCIKYILNENMRFNIYGIYDIFKTLLVLILDIQITFKYLVSILLTILSTFLYTIFPFSYYYIKS